MPPRVTSQRLHRRVVNNLDRTFEGGFKIEANPPLRKVMGLTYRPIMLDWPGVADGHHVIAPVPGEFFDSSDH